jgi:hypothetical protein
MMLEMSSRNVRLTSVTIVARSRGTAFAVFAFVAFDFFFMAALSRADHCAPTLALYRKA